MQSRFGVPGAPRRRDRPARWTQRGGAPASHLISGASAIAAWFLESLGKRHRLQSKQRSLDKARIRRDRSLLQFPLHRSAGSKRTPRFDRAAWAPIDLASRVLHSGSRTRIQTRTAKPPSSLYKVLVWSAWHACSQARRRGRPVCRASQQWVGDSLSAAGAERK